MARNPFSGELGADLESEIENYLRGEDDSSGVGLGFDGRLGAVATAKTVARRAGVPVASAINATVKKYIDDAVNGKVRTALQSQLSNGSGVLAPNLSPGQAFKYEGSICCAVITGSIAAASSASYETEIERPCTIREIRFSSVSETLTLTDFKYGGSFPWLALQFPIALSHFGPGAQNYKVRAVNFGVKTKFRATFANSHATVAATPILEFWGTAAD
jgi:hypothetical protein